MSAAVQHLFNVRSTSVERFIAGTQHVLPASDSYGEGCGAGRAAAIETFQQPHLYGLQCLAMADGHRI